MSKRRRRSYAGCAVDSLRGKLRLRFRFAGPDGRTRQVAWSTGLEDTPENRDELEKIRERIGGLARAGVDPRPHLDALVGQATPAREEPASDEQQDRGPTLRRYYEMWIATVAPVVRKALARDYRRHFDGYILPRLGDVLLENLRPTDIRGLQAELLTKVAVKTAKNVLWGSLRAMLRMAVEDGLVAPGVFPRLLWPEHEVPEPDPFDPKERERILAYFVRKRFGFSPGPGKTGARWLPHPDFHAYVHLLFWTGMRPSEASGLQWRDVDLERGMLYVRRSYHLYGYNAPKTKAARRTVELFPQTVAILTALKKLHVKPETAVFLTTRGEPIEPKTFSEHWYSALRALGLRVRGLYCTKDTYVTTALHAACRIEWLEAQTGVAYATLRKHYGRWVHDEERSELTALARAAAPELLQRRIVPQKSEIVPRAKNFRGISVRGGGLEPPRVLPH